MSTIFKANQGVVTVGEIDSDGETELTLANNDYLLTVYLDRRRAELLIEAIKKQHNL